MLSINMALILIKYNRQHFKLMSLKKMPGFNNYSQIDESDTLIVKTNDNNIANIETDFTMEDDSSLADTEDSEGEEIITHENPGMPDLVIDDEFLADTEGSEDEEIIIHSNSIVTEKTPIIKSDSETDMDELENNVKLSIEDSDSATDEDLFLPNMTVCNTNTTAGNNSNILSAIGFFNSNSISPAPSITPIPDGP